MGTSRGACSPEGASPSSVLTQCRRAPLPGCVSLFVGQLQQPVARCLICCCLHVEQQRLVVEPCIVSLHLAALSRRLPVGGRRGHHRHCISLFVGQLQQPVTRCLICCWLHVEQQRLVVEPCIVSLHLAALSRRLPVGGRRGHHHHDHKRKAFERHFFFLIGDRRARHGPPQAAGTTPGSVPMDPPPLRL